MSEDSITIINRHFFPKTFGYNNIDNLAKYIVDWVDVEFDFWSISKEDGQYTFSFRVGKNHYCNGEGENRSEAICNAMIDYINDQKNND